jgi:hypothetical protein
MNQTQYGNNMSKIRLELSQNKTLFNEIKRHSLFDKEDGLESQNLIIELHRSCDYPFSLDDNTKSEADYENTK